MQVNGGQWLLKSSRARQQADLKNERLVAASRAHSRRSQPHLLLFPAIAIALLSFTFLGDGLRDALDPKLKGKE